MIARLVLIVAVVALVAVAVVAFRNRAAGQGTPATVRQVSTAELAVALERDDVFLLDVREPWEVAQGRVPGAVPIPLGQVAARKAEIPREGAVWIICRSGNRSGQAAQQLAELGWTDVRNVQGGILAWQAEGRPVTR